MVVIKKDREEAKGNKPTLMDVSDRTKDRKLSSKRLEFITELHITNFRLFVEVSFKV